MNLHNPDKEGNRAPAVSPELRDCLRGIGHLSADFPPLNLSARIDELKQRVFPVLGFVHTSVLRRIMLDILDQKPVAEKHRNQAVEAHRDHRSLLILGAREFWDGYLQPMIDESPIWMIEGDHAEPRGKLDLPPFGGPVDSMYWTMLRMIEYAVGQWAAEKAEILEQEPYGLEGLRISWMNDLSRVFNPGDKAWADAYTRGAQVGIGVLCALLEMPDRVSKRTQQRMLREDEIRQVLSKRNFLSLLLKWGAVKSQKVNVFEDLVQQEVRLVWSPRTVAYMGSETNTIRRLSMLAMMLGDDRELQKIMNKNTDRRPIYRPEAFQLVKGAAGLDLVIDPSIVERADKLPIRPHFQNFQIKCPLYEKFPQLMDWLLQICELGYFRRRS